MPAPARPVVRRSTALLAAGLALLSLLPHTAAAWGFDGHRVVGTLAESELSPAARAEVARLLAGEPEPTLAGVSTWADTVRDDPAMRHTGRWHWVNLPRTNPCTYDAARDCPDGDCVVGAIAAQRAILADRSRSDAERRDALKFLVHFVGDVHQPFHAGFGFDRGGNQTQLRFDRQGWNLHSLWDSAMVKHAGLEPAAYARQLRGGPALPADATLALAHPEERWALESCQAIHDDGLYPARRTVGRGYLDRHRPLAETRLRQAGARLAAVLDAALAPAD
jgi:hypothetical protein